MKSTRPFYYLLFIFLFLLVSSPQIRAAEVMLEPSRNYDSAFDLEIEAFSIPEAHDDTGPYVWNVKKNPKEYNFSIDSDQPDSGIDTTYTLSIKPPPTDEILSTQVFITDKKIRTFEHIYPKELETGKYQFSYSAPETGKYRFEIVLDTNNGWVNLRKDIKLQAKAEEKHDSEKKDNYEVKVTKIPSKIYAEHIATFLYEIKEGGKPVSPLEKIDNSHAHFAAWNSSIFGSLKEFIYATPKQGLIGSEVAVSVVFKKPGKHVVFFEYKHNGIIKNIATEVFVFLERTE